MLIHETDKKKPFIPPQHTTIKKNSSSHHTKPRSYVEPTKTTVHAAAPRLNLKSGCGPNTDHSAVNANPAVDESQLIARAKRQIRMDEQQIINGV